MGLHRGVWGDSCEVRDCTEGLGCYLCGEGLYRGVWGASCEVWGCTEGSGVLAVR